ncbi:MAG: hypothetical protein ABIN58_02625, partial [candidate division WOR-3 bacterium]
RVVAQGADVPIRLLGPARLRRQVPKRLVAVAVGDGLRRVRQLRRRTQAVETERTTAPTKLAPIRLTR